MAESGLFRLLLVCLVFTGLSASPLRAAKRVALVIGNSAYSDAPLENAARDAEAVSGMLKSLQFDVTILENASKAQMETAVDAVCRDLSEGDVCLIYYAGHGQSLGEQNYLIPVKTVVDEPQHVELRCVSVNYLLTALRYSGCSLKIVVVDACRNSPFRGFFRSQPGLQKLTAAPEGTIVSFSTSPGTGALEGRKGGNSPFTRHFVRTFRTEAATANVLNLFVRTSQAVRNETGQRPHLTIDASMPEYFLKVKLSGSEPASGDVVTFFFNEAPPPRMETRETPAAGGRGVTGNSIGMSLRLIPAGEFSMGSSTYRRERDDERPQRQVRISRPFYLQTTEVTQKQWRMVMGTEPWKGQRFTKEADDCPAAYVSWLDAVEFCRRLSAAEPGTTYRLPTEAEWEYACRADTTSDFSFGDNDADLNDHAWWGGVYGNGNCRRERYAHAVGLKKPNAFGLHDMHGNVYEWCSDRYADKYETRTSLVDPQGPRSGAQRVLRGGSWNSNASNLRSANRAKNDPDVRDSNYGFRVVREAR